MSLDANNFNSGINSLRNELRLVRETLEKSAAWQMYVDCQAPQARPSMSGFAKFREDRRAEAEVLAAAKTTAKSVNRLY